MKPHPTFNRRAYPVARYIPTPARVIPVVGLMTGHDFIAQFISTTWTSK